jgi:hypothetical protein
MDHAYVSTQIDLPSTKYIGLPGTRDWIIGSEQFLRLGREVIIRILLDHDLHYTDISVQEFQNMINMGMPEGFERRLQVHDTTEGITELHVLEVIIKKLQSLAGWLYWQDRDKSNQVIMNTNRPLTQMHIELQTRDLSEEDRQGINMRISDLKSHLQD